MPDRKSTIHIGLHKTGSTTLQNALYRSRRELSAQGFFYPGDYLRPNFQHSILGVYLRESKIHLFKRAIEPILNDFVVMDDAQLILSGEEFSTVPRPGIHILRESLDRTRRQFQVIVYVRNLYRFAISQIAQHSKGGRFIAYPASVMRRLQDFDPTSMLEGWETAFGEEHVRVFCLETLPEGGIVTHFAGVSGFCVPPDPGATELNRSVDPIASTLLSHLAFEFGVPHRFFYKAYFRATKERRCILPRTEGHLVGLLEDWVGRRNLAHPKLAPHREVLMQQPTIEDNPARSDAEYLHMLSAVLARTAKDMKRARQNGSPSGKQ